MVSQFSRDRQGTRYVFRIRLPGHRTGHVRKGRKPVSIKAMVISIINRQPADKLEKIAVKKRKLVLEAVNIEVLVHIVQVTTLVVGKKE